MVRYSANVSWKMKDIKRDTLETGVPICGPVKKNFCSQARSSAIRLLGNQTFENP